MTFVEAARRRACASWRPHVHCTRVTAAAVRRRVRLRPRARQRSDALPALRYKANCSLPCWTTTATRRRSPSFSTDCPIRRRSTNSCMRSPTSAIESMRRKEDLIKVAMAEEVSHPEGQLCSWRAATATKESSDALFRAEGAHPANCAAIRRGWRASSCRCFFLTSWRDRLWSDVAETSQERAIRTMVDIFLERGASEIMEGTRPGPPARDGWSRASSAP